jgi:hypothetical protein
MVQLSQATSDATNPVVAPQTGELNPALLLALSTLIQYLAPILVKVLQDYAAASTTRAAAQAFPKGSEPSSRESQS